MRLHDIVEKLDLEVLCGEESLDREVYRGYASDLLSDVMANTYRGDLWITLQIHQNIIAVASMNELAGIIIINGRKPEADSLKKAKKEKIPVMASALPAFEIIGRLYTMGITGLRENAAGV
jgi:predicted transcriptional regulator